MYVYVAPQIGYGSELNHGNTIIISNSDEAQFQIGDIDERVIYAYTYFPIVCMSVLLILVI